MAFTSFLSHLRNATQKLVGGAPTPGQLLPPLSKPAPASTPNRPAAPTAVSRSAAEIAAALRSVAQPAAKLPTQAGPVLRGLAWLGPGKTMRIGNTGLELRDPLAYFFVDQLPPDQQEPAAVNLRLPIANQVNPALDHELPYWPRYDQLTVEQRRIYLDWLAHGRATVPPQLGYTFLFIYGLERRALLERQDVKLIFKEVFRLRQVYARSGQAVSRSFDNYTSSFLWFLLLCEPSVFATRHFEAFAKSATSWDDDRLASALCWLARNNQALPDWLAFVLAAQMPKSQRSVVTKRVGDEMRELFAKRYREQFGAGLQLKTPKRDRKFSYRPASAALSPLEVVGPNPMGLSSQFNVLSDLWNGCISDLKRLSSAVGNSIDGEAMTVDKWKAMPVELRSSVDHPLADRFAQFIEQHTVDSSLTMVPARALATIAGIAPDAKLTAAACRRMAETVADVGYCIEPDVRVTGQAYDDEDPVVLFLNLDEGSVDSARYAAASTMLVVGLALASADGSPEDGELSLLTQQIDSGFELNEHERRRLGMLRALRTAKGTELSQITKPLKRLPAPERDRVAKFALALVAADGVVTKEEMKAVRRLYSAIGFSREQADAALAALTQSATSDEPVAVLPATTGAPGEAIPLPPAEVSGGLKLNRAAIAAILKDTQEVSQMLAAAMGVASEEQEPAAPAQTEVPVPTAHITTSTVESAVDPTVPVRYAAFYQVVVSRPQWPRSELAELAKQHGLMLAGAVEAINDWSTDKNGGPILYEDDQQFTLEAAYLN